MQYHAPSGLYLTKYRAYDPKDGRWLSRDPIEEAGGINLYAYVGGNPVNYNDPLGLATPSDIALALGLIKERFPELYPIAPTSVTPTDSLSTWYGAPLQGYTDLQNNIQINANLYGDCKTPVIEMLYPEFLQTIAHEWLHVQQSAFEKMLTHGELHQQIDKNAELISMQIWEDFSQLRNLTPQDRCSCQ
jgi:RHS repeat-associated protein